MAEMVSYCGLVCTECPAFLATQADDDAQRAEVAVMWSQVGEAQLKPEDINCDGCLSVDGQHILFWDTCEVRVCAQERSVANCAHCGDYACEKLDPCFAMAPEAKTRLDGIRSGP